MSEIIPAQLAKILNLKRQAVYMAIRRGNIDLNSGGMIDTKNTKNQSWLISHGLSEISIQSALDAIHQTTKSNPKIKAQSNQLPEIREKTKEKPITIQPQQIEAIEKYIGNNQTQSGPSDTNIDAAQFEDVTGLPERMMNLTLYELVKRYGGPMNLESWSKILQRLMGAMSQDQKIQERRLTLIEKDFVISRLLQYLETLSNRLFDYTESAPIDFISLVKAGGENIEIEIKKKMRKDFSISIKDTKEALTRELESLKKKYEKKSDDE
ncbi:MAG: hypothetical protein PHS93_07880 [Candidatus Omnitrophica bacterium]|nr:hypothetical protein [Candidatus Omnitrophota bacterium]